MTSSDLWVWGAFALGAAAGVIVTVLVYGRELVSIQRAFDDEIRALDARIDLGRLELSSLRSRVEALTPVDVAAVSTAIGSTVTPMKRTRPAKGDVK